MNTDKLEQIKARHERELQEAIRKKEIAESLPLQGGLVCLHKDHASVVYGKTFPQRYSFKEACGIYALFTPVEAEDWSDGCRSIRPAEINSYAKSERAKMNGTCIAEIKIAAGKGYTSHELRFWARVDGRLIHVGVKINPEWKWLPDVKFTYNQDGDCITKRCIPADIGEDSRVKWWSPDGSYQISYFFADDANFRAFAGMEYKSVAA